MCWGEGGRVGGRVGVGEDWGFEVSGLIDPSLGTVAHPEFQTPNT